MVKACRLMGMVAAMIAASTTSAAAQSTPAQGKAPVTLTAGYQLQRVGETNMAKGGFADISFGSGDVEGVLQVGASFKSSTSSFTSGAFSNSSEATLTMSRLVGGVRLRPFGKKTSPYIHALGGLIRAGADGSSTSTGPTGTRTTEFDGAESEGAVQLGVGVDVTVSTKMSVRLGGDYMRVLADGGGNVWLASAGLSFGLGRR